MSAHNNGSGPRSNSYSENRFTNWSEYEPWWLEIQAVFKRFDGRIAKRPAFPKIMEFARLEGFIHACSVREIEAQLRTCPPEFLKGLRAVFLLSGTTKQLKKLERIGDRFMATTGIPAFFYTPTHLAGQTWIRFAPLFARRPDSRTRPSRGQA